MALTSNPFVVLSYVSGPALLTNASSLLLLSTTNRFARAVDRSRELMARLETPEGRAANLEYSELRDVRRRVQLIAFALSCLYLAASMFGLATLVTIVGAVIAELTTGSLLASIVAIAAAAGVVGFLAFVAAGIILTIESRLAMRSLVRESDATLKRIGVALGRT